MNGGRFQADVDWSDFDGNSGAGMVTDGQRFEDGGWFFFFGSSADSLNPDGLDLLVQILDRCNQPGFNNFWVFAAAATDVEYTLRVTDTQTNQVRTYSNPLGAAADAITDTEAFATCP